MKQEEREKIKYRLINYNSIEALADRILELQDRLEAIEQCVEDYVVEDEDCGKMYTPEEKDILKIIRGE